MKKLLIVLALSCSGSVFAQNDFNIQSLTPSALLRVGTIEVKSFNNFYRQTHFFNDQGNRQRLQARSLFNNDGSTKATPDNIQETFLTSINQLTYGLSTKVNVGLDFWLNSSQVADISDSRFAVLGFRQTANSRTALSYIGPRLKLSPFSNLPTFSLQTTFLIPIAGNLQGFASPQPFLNFDSYIWLNQFFFDKSVGAKTLLFFNTDLMLSFNRNSEITSRQSTRVAVPLRVFLNYFATDRLTLQLQNEFTPIFQGVGPITDRSTPTSNYWQAGGSVKYQLIRSKLELETSATQFLLGRNSGAGNTINFGIRLLLN